MCASKQCLKFIKRFNKSFSDCYANIASDDQTARMRRLILVYTGHKGPKVGFSAAVLTFLCVTLIKNHFFSLQSIAEYYMFK